MEKQRRRSRPTAGLQSNPVGAPKVEATRRRLLPQTPAWFHRAKGQRSADRNCAGLAAECLLAMAWRARARATESQWQTRSQRPRLPQPRYTLDSARSPAEPPPEREPPLASRPRQSTLIAA